MLYPSVKSRKKSSPSFAAKLAAYSATAAAAVAIVPSAEAVGGNVADGINFSGSPSLSLNFGNAHASFQFGPLAAEFSAKGSNRPYGSFTELGQGVAFKQQAGQNVFAATVDEEAVNLAAGDPLTGLNFGHYGLLAEREGSISNGALNTTFVAGPLKNGGTGYFGFKVEQNALTYYGWMRVKVGVNASNFATSVAFVPNGDGIFGAYLSTDDPNFSAFKVGDAAPVPEPTSSALVGLGLLALGAAGVRELRRRRAQTV